jgi:hypothetical protein
LCLRHPRVKPQSESRLGGASGRGDGRAVTENNAIDQRLMRRQDFLMSILDGLEKLINEHGSAVIIAERLALARDQYTALERKASELERQAGKLEAKLEREIADYQSAKDELQRLKKEHEEEVRIALGIELRRGKRTGHEWMAFCPTCHGPVDFSTGIARCANQKCKWGLMVDAKMMEDAIAQLK